MADGKAFPQVRSEVAATSIVAGFLVFLLAGMGFVIGNAYNDASEIARSRAISSAEVVAANFEWVNQVSRQLLQRMDDFVGSNLEGLPVDALRFMKDSVVPLPGSPRIYLVRADGQTELTTDPDFKPIDIRDRDYFKAVANGEHWYFSAMLVSRLNGQQIFVISKRIERNGIFVGAAIISFNSDLTKKVWESLQLDSTSTISVLRDDGPIVTRYPLLAGPLDAKDSPLFKIYLPQSDAGSYEAVSMADGIKRIAAYKRVPGTRLIAATAIGHDFAFAPFYQFTLMSLAVAVPIVLFFASLLWFTYKWLRAEAIQREQLATALERNQMLFREIHHRVKNNLQAVNSLIGMQKIEPQAKLEMSQRIMAMIAVHEQIYRKDQFGMVDASAYIPAIVDRLLVAYGRNVDVDYDLEPLEVDREYAVPLGLITNEVVSNAIKHGFVGRKKGWLQVIFRKSDNGAEGILSVTDNGPGFDPDKSNKGMGSKLLKGLAGQILGEYQFIFDNGTTFELRFPLRPPGNS